MQDFGAQYLAYASPCQRFAAPSRLADAWLGCIAARYALPCSGLSPPTLYRFSPALSYAPFLSFLQSTKIYSTPVHVLADTFERGQMFDSFLLP